MRIHVVDQRTPEWLALRAGKLTGSCAKHVTAKGRSGGEAVTRRDLRFKLIAERLSGRPQEDTYVNDAMRWGIEHEDEAIRAYEAAQGVFVDGIGFCEHDSLLAGTSPDGFVGTDGIVSVKCPKTSTHIQYLREGLEPSEHAPQNTHELWLTGRQWVDFVSYDPRLSEGLRLFILRVTRTSAELALYDRDARAFLDEVAVELDGIKSLAFRKAVA